MIYIDKNRLISQLNKRIFWDTNIDVLDYYKNRQLIIERIAVYGTEHDERIMNMLYCAGTIKECLMASRNITGKVIKYYAFVLNVRESDFRCYTKMVVQRHF